MRNKVFCFLIAVLTLSLFALTGCSSTPDAGADTSKGDTTGKGASTAAPTTPGTTSQPGTGNSMKPLKAPMDPSK